MLRDHLAQSSRNATYTSSCIQNQILDILGSTIVRKIVQKVRDATYFTVIRVTNLKSVGMQNQSTSVFSVRSTLGNIETTPQIGEILEKVCENTMLNHEPKYKKMAT